MVEINRMDFGYTDPSPTTDQGISAYATILDTEEERDEEDEAIVNEFLAFKTSMLSKRPPGSRMNRNTWTSLEKDTQTAWDTISDKDKAKILQYAQNKSTKGPSNKTLETKVHELEHDEEGTDDHEDTPTESKLEVNTHDAITTAKNEAHPGDPRAMLSTKPKKAAKMPNPESGKGPKKIACNYATFTSNDEHGFDEDAIIDDLCRQYWDEVEEHDSDFRKGD